MKLTVLESQDGLGIIYANGKHLFLSDSSSELFSFLDKLEERFPKQKIFERIFIDKDIYDLPIPETLEEFLYIIN